MLLPNPVDTSQKWHMNTPPTPPVSYCEHASEILGHAAQLIKMGQPVALITSLAIEGGAARETGSLALVDGQGNMMGYLSNGCIDRDIQYHAMSALEGGQKTLILYGEGSRYADLRLPCGGSLSVLIDPQPEAEAIIAAAQGLAERQPQVLSFSAQEGAAAPVARQFRYAPRRRLVLAGRGAIFRSVAEIGHAAGYELCLLSPDDQDLAAVGHLSLSEPQHLSTPDTAPRLDMLDAHSAFLTLFHDHDWEPTLLRAALASPALFIGSLGSRHTHALRCEALRLDGVPEADLARLRGPIGLVPSLREAPLIALSTLAEIVEAFPPAIEPVV